MNIPSCFHIKFLRTICEIPIKAIFLSNLFFMYVYRRAYIINFLLWYFLCVICVPPFVPFLCYVFILFMFICFAFAGSSSSSSFCYFASTVSFPFELLLCFFLHFIRRKVNFVILSVIILSQLFSFKPQSVVWVYS